MKTQSMMMTALGALASLLVSCAMDHGDQSLTSDDVTLEMVELSTENWQDAPANGEDFQTEATVFDLCGEPPFCPAGTQTFAAWCDATCYTLGYDCFWGYNRVTCVSGPATGTISATPQTVSVPTGGLGNSSICWDVDFASTGEVWVSANGAAETLFARDPSGCQNAAWIQVNHSYEFNLYEGTAHSNQLASVTVTGVAGGDPPSECSSCPAGYSCHCGTFEGCIRDTNQCP